MKCIVPPREDSGKVTVTFKSSGHGFNSKSYYYESNLTPSIISFTPNNGVAGDKISVQLGNTLSPNTTDYTISFGNGGKCDVVDLNNSTNSLECVLQSHPAGAYNMSLDVFPYGRSNSSAFTYNLDINPSPVGESGFGGGHLLTLNGQGFSDETIVTICESPCKLVSVHQESILKCLTPMYAEHETRKGDVQCNIKIQQNAITKEFASAYSYKESLTSEILDVSSRRLGTGGGKRLTVTGTNFRNTVPGQICYQH